MLFVLGHLYQSTLHFYFLYFPCRYLSYNWVSFVLAKPSELILHIALESVKYCLNNAFNSQIKLIKDINEVRLSFQCVKTSLPFVHSFHLTICNRTSSVIIATNCFRSRLNYRELCHGK